MRLGTICALHMQPKAPQLTKELLAGVKLPFRDAVDFFSVASAHLELALAVCWAASSSCALAAVFFSNSTASWAWFSSCCS